MKLSRSCKMYDEGRYKTRGRPPRQNHSHETIAKQLTFVGCARCNPFIEIN